MTDKVQKIREEVERLKGWNNNVRNSTRHMTLQEEDFNRGKHSSYLEILNFIDSLQEEPISIDFEQELYKAFGQVKDFTLGMRIAKWFYDIGKNSQEHVSEELEKEIQTWADYFKKRSSEFNRFFFEKTARHFAEWQKQKMMKNAIDAVVNIDAGGYPYIPQIELYDYDKDAPLAKEGDKYKVVLVKDD